MNIIEICDGIIILDNIYSVRVTLTSKRDNCEFTLKDITKFDRNTTTDYGDYSFNLKINGDIIYTDSYEKVLEIYDKIILKLKINEMLN